MSIIITGCSGPAGIPAPKINEDKKFYYDEGAHFEIGTEFWSVHGFLNYVNEDAGKDPMVFTAQFHRAGNSFMHARSGYNSIRLSDGSYDYSSFGMGIFMGVIKDLLRMKIEKYPEAEYLKYILNEFEAGNYTKYIRLTDGEYDLYRTYLYINYGANRFERVSESEFKYELDLNTSLGKLNLKMNAETDPMLYTADNIMYVTLQSQNRDEDAGKFQGYAFPFVKVSGMMNTEDGEKAVEGIAWFEHWWGNPEGPAMENRTSVYQRTSDGGAFMVNEFRSKDGKLKNSYLHIIRPDGSVEKSEQIELEPVSSWKSPVSLTEYNSGWKVAGDNPVSGIISIDKKYQNSEIMLEEGIGNFWLGPCSFSGKVEKGILKKKLDGEGFCRVISTVNVDVSDVELPEVPGK